MYAPGVQGCHSTCSKLTWGLIAADKLTCHSHGRAGTVGLAAVCFILHCSTPCPEPVVALMMALVASKL